MLPVILDDKFINDIKQQLPELPDVKRARFTAEYKLNDYDAGVLTASRDLAEFYETAAKTCGDPKLAANWVSSELLGLLNKEHISIINSPISADNFGKLLYRIHDKTISGKIAKTIFPEMFARGGNADEIIAKQGLKQVTDTGAIEKMIDEVLTANPQQLADYRAGKEQLLGFFVGQVMKASRGKANPAQVNDILRGKLSQ